MLSGEETYTVTVYSMVAGAFDHPCQKRCVCGVVQRQPRLILHQEAECMSAPQPQRARQRVALVAQLADRVLHPAARSGRVTGRLSITLDTVWVDTPASCATSRIVGRPPLAWFTR